MRLARDHRADGRGRGARAERRVRGRGGAPHRDQREVHPRAARGRLRGRRSAPRALVHGPGRPVRAVAGRAAVGAGPGRPAARPAPIGFRAMQIDGSGALIAGGASGLGEATARLLHAHGAEVVIADLNEQKGAGLAGELGERASFVPADVTEPDQVQAAVDAAAARTRRAPDQRLLRRDRLGRARREQPRSAPAAAVRDGDPGQPDRHLQRAAARRRRDARERARSSRASAACASTPPRSRRSTARSGRSPTRRRRAASSG